MSRFTVHDLAATIDARAVSGGNTSYTRKLLDKGVAHCAKKMGEEAVETVIAALGDDLPGVSTAVGKPTITLPKGTPPTTLVTKTVVSGTGDTVRSGDLLVVQYVGVKWADGKTFDSSWQRGVPAGFGIGVGQVIKGWDDGLVGHKVGDRVLLVVPPSEGYGAQGQSQAGISGTDTLVFAVDIVGTYH